MITKNKKSVNHGRLKKCTHEMTYVHNTKIISKEHLKSCVHYTFTSLFCISKREHLWNKENNFFFTSKAPFVLEIIKF